MRCHKQPLIKVSVSLFIGADFKPDGRSGQPSANFIDVFLPAAYITARGSNSPAGIFDERADYEICTAICGLNLFNKFAVTVVHKDTAAKT